MEKGAREKENCFCHDDSKCQASQLLTHRKDLQSRTHQWIRITFILQSESFKNRISRSAGLFIDAKGKATLEIEFSSEPGKEDKIVIQYAEVPAEETDPMAPFNAGAQQGEVKLAMESFEDNRGEVEKDGKKRKMKDADKKDDKKDDDNKEDKKEDEKKDDNKKEDKKEEKDDKKEEEKKDEKKKDDKSEGTLNDIWKTQKKVVDNTENQRMEQTQVTVRRRSPSKPIFIRRATYQFENSSLTTSGNRIINSLRVFGSNLVISAGFEASLTKAIENKDIEEIINLNDSIDYSGQLTKAVEKAIEKSTPYETSSKKVRQLIAEFYGLCESLGSIEIPLTGINSNYVKLDGVEKIIMFIVLRIAVPTRPT